MRRIDDCVGTANCADHRGSLAHRTSIGYTMEPEANTAPLSLMQWSSSTARRIGTTLFTTDPLDARLAGAVEDVRERFCCGFRL